MKTRILHTKFWKDPYIRKLTPMESYLYLYYLLNEHIGLSGIYELAIDSVVFETKMSEAEIILINRKFQQDKKVYFYDSWIIVANMVKYNNYSGSKNLVAYEKELGLIPNSVTNYIKNTVSILYTYPMDSPINHKSKSISKDYMDSTESRVKFVKKEDGTTVAVMES